MIRTGPLNRRVTTAPTALTIPLGFPPEDPFPDPATRYCLLPEQQRTCQAQASTRAGKFFTNAGSLVVACPKSKTTRAECRKTGSLQRSTRKVSEKSKIFHPGRDSIFVLAVAQERRANICRDSSRRVMDFVRGWQSERRQGSAGKPGRETDSSESGAHRPPSQVLCPLLF